MQLPKYYQHIFNTQTVVVWESYYFILTQHQLQLGI